MTYVTATLKEVVGSQGMIIDGDWVESKDQDPNGDVRLIQLADIGTGEFLDRSNRFMSSTKAKKLNCTLIEPNDILVARMPDRERFEPESRTATARVDHRAEQ